MYTKQILGGWDLTESDFNFVKNGSLIANGAQKNITKRGGSYCCIR